MTFMGILFEVFPLSLTAVTNIKTKCAIANLGMSVQEGGSGLSAG